MSRIFYSLVAALGTVCFIGCASTPRMSFQRDIRPILVDKCVACHSPPYGEGYRSTGLNLQNYTSLMNGSIYGPVVVPGNSESSPLIMLIEGRAGELRGQLTRMHKPITEAEVRSFRVWVDQGAPDN